MRVLFALHVVRSQSDRIDVRRLVRAAGIFVRAHACVGVCVKGNVCSCVLVNVCKMVAMQRRL